jgi:hypothetical protein
VQLDHVREHVEVLGLLSQLGAAALHVGSPGFHDEGCG